MNVGKNIEDRRKKAGLTQGELAEKVGISGAMVCQIERGTKNPSLQVAALMAKAFGCEVSELVD